MLRHSKKFLLGGFLGLFSGEDDPYTVTEQMMKERIKEFEESMPTDPWERVKFGLLHKDKYGERGPVFQNLYQGSVCSVILGAFYGGIKKAHVAHMDFMRTNQATAFLTHLDAKKRLQDRMMVSFLSGAAQLGWRTGLFTFMFIGVSNSIALYRNKDGILEYAIGGAVAGASYRMFIGLRQTIVGGILGLGFGASAGVVSKTILYLTGCSMTEVRHAQYSLYIHRESQDKRANDLAARDVLTLEEKSEMVQKIESDEKAKRIEDNLENV
ncbi:RPII140-upstream gene protein [Thrips palmi]|uniref:Complex I assembly factor TIMMDC1, mitochondrial n=1 Tax=Thrips palmi TaxID=161013 RepID=A0A6P8YQN1_THRPL|nr:RPII140-upstream gene protein [Thrips palmi]